MILLVYNILMAIIFSALVGFTFVNFIVGYLLGLIILAFMPQLPDAKAFLFPTFPTGKRMVKYSWSLVIFSLDFLWDLTVSNLQIAWDVITPKDYYQPMLLKVPIDDLTDFELTLLASRITLTPGTLSADITADRRFLVVHVMYPSDGDMAAQLRRPIDILKGNT